jgi:hypothetical protein
MMPPNESPPEDVGSQGTLSIIQPPIAPLPSDIAHQNYGSEAIAKNRRPGRRYMWTRGLISFRPANSATDRSHHGGPPRATSICPRPRRAPNPPPLPTRPYPAVDLQRVDCILVGRRIGRKSLSILNFSLIKASAQLNTLFQRRRLHYVSWCTSHVGGFSTWRKLGSNSGGMNSVRTGT